MQPDYGPHAGEDTLELYSMGKLQDPDLASLEEHLLVCTECQDRAAEADSFVWATRVAAAGLRKEKSSGTLGSFRHFWWKPLAASAAVVLVILGLYWVGGSRFPGRRQAPVAVVLQSLRGDQSIVNAPAGRPLTLQLDLTGLPAGSAFTAEVVDSEGRQVWTAVTSPPGRTLALSSGLANGTYWIRLYGGEGRRELMREFGLRVE